MKITAYFFVLLAIISSSSHGTIPESQPPLSEEREFIELIKNLDKEQLKTIRKKIACDSTEKLTKIRHDAITNEVSIRQKQHREGMIAWGILLSAIPIVALGTVAYHIINLIKKK